MNQTSKIIDPVIKIAELFKIKPRLKITVERSRITTVK
jgi:hypothetical protein